MRYTRELMTGDDITVNDLAPSALDIIGTLPAIPAISTKKTRDLDSLPVRVKTRYGGRAGRRVVSAPTFDLVASSKTGANDLSFFKQPRLSHIDYEKPSSNPQQRRSLPPLPSSNRLSVLKQGSSQRHVSMPMGTFNEKPQSSYTNQPEPTQLKSRLDPGLAPFSLHRHTISEASSEGDSSTSSNPSSPMRNQSVYKRSSKNISSVSLFSDDHNDDTSSSLYSNESISSNDSLEEIVELFVSIMNEGKAKKLTKEVDLPPMVPKKELLKAKTPSAMPVKQEVDSTEFQNPYATRY